jgi:Zn-dependent protease
LLYVEKGLGKMLQSVQIVQPVQADVYTPIIAQYFRIDITEWGDSKKKYLVRYVGQLHSQDSAQAYDQISKALRSEHVTPLFRLEGDQQVIQLINGVIQTRPSRIRWNIIFFILTVMSVTFTGAILFAPDLPTGVTGWFKFLLSGLPFTISLMTILLCHEFGHYFVSRYHKTASTLPLFIPLPYPVSILGTLGAVIQLKEPPRNRRILLDIGIAGPIAGLVVAIPILILGLYLSPVIKLTNPLPTGQMIEGNSVLYLFLKFLVKGQLLPQPLTYGGMNPIMYWIRYFFTGLPLPSGGLYIDINQIAWAGWIGLLVTAFNLIPAGQLDGGHVMYVLLGKHTTKLLPFILLVMVALCFVSVSWVLPTFLIFLLGRYHAEPLDQITPLDPKRKALAIFGVVIFFLVFMPVPFT